MYWVCRIRAVEGVCVGVKTVSEKVISESMVGEGDIRTTKCQNEEGMKCNRKRRKERIELRYKIVSGSML